MAIKGSNVVMTGGSGGIGQILTARLLAEGARVSVLSRKATIPPGATHRHVDFSTPAGIAAAQTVVAQCEPDILINLAGVQYFGPAEEQGFEDLCKSYLINLVAPVALCQAAVPPMKRRNSGQIVIIGSVFGSIPFAHFAAYSSAKGGLRAYSEALRRELIDTDIAVTYISPRGVRTKLITPKLRKYAEMTGMALDDPAQVAGHIVWAIERRLKEVCIGFPERLFVRLNAILPRLIDAAVAGNDRKSKELFGMQCGKGGNDGQHI